MLGNWWRKSGITLTEPDSHRSHSQTTRCFRMTANISKNPALLGMSRNKAKQNEQPRPQSQPTATANNSYNTIITNKKRGMIKRTGDLGFAKDILELRKEERKRKGRALPLPL